MKVAVVGSRTCPREWAFEHLNVESGIGYLSPVPPPEIVSGGAAGADTWAYEWLRRANDVEEADAYLYKYKPALYTYKEFPADWDKHGKKAGFLRNVDIADYADACIALWDGKSKGTRHTINLFLDRGKPVTVRIFDE